MPLAARHVLYADSSDRSFSTGGLAAIVAAHVAVLALLFSLDVMPLPPPTVMVNLVAAMPTAQVSPPRPSPSTLPPRVEHQPPVRPQPRPAPTLTSQPPLAAQSDAPAVGQAAPASEPTAPSAASSASAHAAATVSATVSAPRFDAGYLSNPAPTYPSLSRKLGEEGRVVLRVLVDAGGRPGRIEISSSSAWPRLDQAAQDAVARWKFVPARRGDETVDAWVLVPIVFNLRS